MSENLSEMPSSEDEQISVISKHAGDVGHQTLWSASNNTKIDQEIISTNKETITACLSKQSFHLIENNDDIISLVMGDKSQIGETKGNVQEKFITGGNQNVEYVRGGDLNYSVHIEGNELIEEKCNGDLNKTGETKGNVQEKFITMGINHIHILR